MAELEIVGYLAGFLVAVALSPQLIKTWKTKSTKDISILWTLIYMTGLLLWVIYAIVNRIVPLAIFTTIEFSMATALFIFKLLYK
ncbi:MAG: PQ-loop repeat-containing protein [Candidatus Aenigmarchaeota archaeon]|nr:PQ-loop repeat-containing protein [Candidatus Aenigmarchaeota archaeon]